MFRQMAEQRPKSLRAMAHGQAATVDRFRSERRTWRSVLEPKYYISFTGLKFVAVNTTSWILVDVPNCRIRALRVNMGIQ
jgi:hypothetical protein